MMKGINNAPSKLPVSLIALSLIATVRKLDQSIAVAIGANKPNDFEKADVHKPCSILHYGGSCTKSLRDRALVSGVVLSWDSFRNL